MATRRTTVPKGGKPPAKKKPAARKPRGGGRSTGGSSARRGGGATFDVIPGTHLDEYVGPWVAALAVLPVLGGVMHVYWGPGHGVGRLLVTLLVTLLLGGGAAVLGLFTYRDAAPRGEFVALRAAWSVVLALVELIVHLWISPLARPWLTIWLVVGGLTALSWNIRRTEVVRGDGTDQHQQAHGWDHTLGLPGSTAKVVDEDDDKRVIRVRTKDGQNLGDVQEALARIEAVAGGRLGSARAIPLPGGRAAGADVVLMKRDVLAEQQLEPRWDGRRRSFADGAAPARYEDGSPVLILQAGRGKPPAHVQIMGMTRAGKSQLARLMARFYARASDVVFWLSDTIKGAQTVRPIRPAIDWFADSRAETRAMFNATMAVVRYRADWLGERGIDEWHEGCGIPALVVWIEEAAEVLADSEMYVRLVRAAASAGVFLVDSMQRASYAEKPTSARAQMGISLCFAVLDPDDAGFVLPDDVMASAIPHLWGSRLDEHRGYFYVVGPGMDAEHRVMPARTWSDDVRQIAADIREAAPGMAQLDEGSARAAGEVYAARSRWTPDEDERPAGTRTVPGTVLQVQDEDGPQDGPEDEDQDEDQDDDQDDEDDELEAERMAEDEAEAREWVRDAIGEPDPEIAAELAAADPRAEPDDPELPDIRFDEAFVPGPEPTLAEKNAHWDRIVQQAVDLGGEVSTEWLVDRWYELPGLLPGSRPAMYYRLRKLADDELAEDLGRGKWRILRGAIGAEPPTESDEDED